MTVSSYTDISNRDLDEMVKSIQQFWPCYGLGSPSKYHVQRRRPRESVDGNDPIHQRIRGH